MFFLIKCLFLSIWLFVWLFCYLSTLMLQLIKNWKLEYLNIYTIYIQTQNFEEIIVVSLFTSIGFDLVVSSLKSRWINLVLNFTCFTFINKYFHQILGPLMGSVLSPILVSHKKRGEFFSREKLIYIPIYVDDIFGIIPSDELMNC